MNDIQREKYVETKAVNNLPSFRVGIFSGSIRLRVASVRRHECEPAWNLLSSVDQINNMKFQFRNTRFVADVMLIVIRYEPWPLGRHISVRAP